LHLQAPVPNVIFDESGNFIIFAGLLGIKVSASGSAVYFFSGLPAASLS
jgi:hypothetical protein